MTTKTKYTRAYDWSDVVVAGRDLAEFTKHDAPNMANRLLKALADNECGEPLHAAAPDLLEACQVALDGKGDWRALCQIAIRKATGEES